jgi:large subunit ribosomal protein L25
VPAVLYGHGEAPKHIAIPARELAAAIRHGGMTQVFDIRMSDGTSALALPKAIQRDPIKDTFEHVDLLLVRRGEMVSVEIPIILVGEAARETLVMHEHQTLLVQADATRLPDHLDASIEGLEAGTRVTAADIKLPDGVELATDPDLTIAIIAGAPTAAEMAEEGGEDSSADATAEAAPAEV